MTVRNLIHTFFIIVSILMLLTSVSVAEVRHFGASVVHAKWELTERDGFCQLTHQIPNYGQAIFINEKDDELAFLLRAKRGPVLAKHGALLAVPPLWRKNKIVRKLQSLKVTDSKTPVELKGEQARRVMTELEDGIFPTFYYQPSVSSDEAVMVAISSVNFRSALNKFISCEQNVTVNKLETSEIKVAKLPPLKKKSVRPATTRKGSIKFAKGSAKLNQKDRELLNDLIYYMKVNPDVSTVMVTGYADTSGDSYQSIDLSWKRSRTVREYFIAKGIPPKKLRAQFSGTYSPEQAQDAGSARNQRISINLIK